MWGQNWVFFLFVFNEDILWETSDSTRTVRRILGVSKAEEREKGSERLCIETIAWEFPKSGKEPNAHIHRGIIIGHVNVSMQKTFSNTHVLKLSKVNERKDFPGGSIEESACQGGNRHWVDPWSGKIPHAPESRSRAPQLLSLQWGARALQPERSARWEVLELQWRVASPPPQPEKAPAKQGRLGAVSKNHYKK